MLSLNKRDIVILILLFIICILMYKLSLTDKRFANLEQKLDTINTNIDLIRTTLINDYEIENGKEETSVQR